MASRTRRTHTPVAEDHDHDHDHDYDMDMDIGMDHEDALRASARQKYAPCVAATLHLVEQRFPDCSDAEEKFKLAKTFLHSQDNRTRVNALLRKSDRHLSCRKGTTDLAKFLVRLRAQIQDEDASEIVLTRRKRLLARRLTCRTVRARASPVTTRVEPTRTPASSSAASALLARRRIHDDDEDDEDDAPFRPSASHRPPTRTLPERRSRYAPRKRDPGFLSDFEEDEEDEVASSRDSRQVNVREPWASKHTRPCPSAGTAATGHDQLASDTDVDDMETDTEHRLATHTLEDLASLLGVVPATVTAQLHQQQQQQQQQAALARAMFSAPKPQVQQQQQQQVVNNTSTNTTNVCPSESAVEEWLMFHEYCDDTSPQAQQDTVSPPQSQSQPPQQPQPQPHIERGWSVSSDFAGGMPVMAKVVGLTPAYPRQMSLSYPH